MDAKTIIDQTEKYYLPVFGRYQLALTHGKGCKLYDADGNEYLDFLAGIAVNSLGHAHPALVKAISEQAAKLMHCSNIYYTEDGLPSAQWEIMVLVTEDGHEVLCW